MLRSSLAAKQGHVEAAIAELQAVLEAQRESGSRIVESGALVSMGNCERQRENWDEAMTCYHRGNRIKRTLNPFDLAAERANTERIIE